MTGDEIYFILRTLEEEHSINAKVEMLEELLEDPLFEKVINLAYNPFIRFHMTSDALVGVSGEGSKELDEHEIDILESLAERLDTGNKAKAIVSEAVESLSEESAW